MVVTINAAINRENLHVNSLDAYGTSEGAKKGWDSRGRGRTKKTPHPKSWWKNQAGYVAEVSPTAVIAERKRLAARYKELGKILDKAGKKVEHIENVKSIGWKLMHFMKSIGDWVESFSSLKDTVMVASLAVWGVLHEANVHIAKMHAMFQWAYAHIAPVVHAATLAAVHSGL